MGESEPVSGGRDAHPTVEAAGGRDAHPTESPGDAAATAADTRNGLAVAALIVGILAIVLAPVGPVLGVTAVAVGIVALARARNLPAVRSGRGLAAAGIGLGLVGAVAWTLVLSEVMWWRVVAAKRAACASNLKGIATGMKVYSNDNLDWLPIRMFGEPPEGAGNRTHVSFVGQMGAYYKTLLSDNPRSYDNADGMRRYPRPDPAWLATALNSVHPSRSMFLMVIDGSCTAKQFVCPSSGDTEDDFGWPRVSRGAEQHGGGQGGPIAFDFSGYDHVSYGYQLPFGHFARPNEYLDPRVAFLADKGPFYQAGTPRADGSVPDQPTVPPGTLLGLQAGGAAPVLPASDRQWRAYNSRNHGQDGQNVMFADGHLEFVRRPTAGVDGDNIYTMQEPGGGPASVQLGRVPADKLGPLTNTDSVIVP